MWVVASAIIGERRSTIAGLTPDTFMPIVESEVGSRLTKILLPFKNAPLFFEA
jgi:hypothetical protein